MSAPQIGQAMAWFIKHRHGGIDSIGKIHFFESMAKSYNVFSGGATYRLYDQADNTKNDEQ
jgi:hypothetical protein